MPINLKGGVLSVEGVKLGHLARPQEGACPQKRKEDGTGKEKGGKEADTPVSSFVPWDEA